MVIWVAIKFAIILVEFSKNELINELYGVKIIFRLSHINNIIIYIIIIY